jgi:hypothetical protein
MIQETDGLTPTVHRSETVELHAFTTLHPTSCSTSPLFRLRSAGSANDEPEVGDQGDEQTDHAGQHDQSSIRQLVRLGRLHQQPVAKVVSALLAPAVEHGGESFLADGAHQQHRGILVVVRRAVWFQRAACRTCSSGGAVRRVEHVGLREIVAANLAAGAASLTAASAVGAARPRCAGSADGVTVCIGPREFRLIEVAIGFHAAIIGSRA